MSLRPTCCPREKRRSNHEINRYVYPPWYQFSALFLEYIGVFCAKSSGETLITLESSRESCSRRFSFQPIPTEAAGRVGIGRDRVPVLVLSGVMISIKYIYMHIGQESSVGFFFTKSSRIYRIGNCHFVIFFPLLPQGGGSVAIRNSSGLCRYS